jgi:hypothetical protein
MCVFVLQEERLPGDVKGTRPFRLHLSRYRAQAAGRDHWVRAHIHTAGATSVNGIDCGRSIAQKFSVLVSYKTRPALGLERDLKPDPSKIKQSKNHRQSFLQP